MGELIDLTSQVQNLRTLNVPDHRRTWRAGPGTTPDTRERTASEGAPSDARTISRGARGSFGFHGTAASARQGAPTLQEPTSETLLVVQRVRLVHPTVVAATTLEQESVPYTRMKISRHLNQKVCGLLCGSPSVLRKCLGLTEEDADCRINSQQAAPAPNPKPEVRLPKGAPTCPRIVLLLARISIRLTFCRPGN